MKEEDKGEAMYFDDENIPDEEDETQDQEPKLSKKARKAKNKLTVAELKVCSHHLILLSILFLRSKLMFPCSLLPGPRKAPRNRRMD